MLRAPAMSTRGRMWCARCRKLPGWKTTSCASFLWWYLKVKQLATPCQHHFIPTLLFWAQTCQKDRQTDGLTSRSLAPHSAFLRCSATSSLLSAGRQRPDDLEEAEMKGGCLVSWFSCEEWREENKKKKKRRKGDGDNQIRTNVRDAAPQRPWILPVLCRQMVNRSN